MERVRGLCKARVGARRCVRPPPEIGSAHVRTCRPSTLLLFLLTRCPTCDLLVALPLRVSLSLSSPSSSDSSLFELAVRDPCSPRSPSMPTDYLILLDALLTPTCPPTSAL